MKIFLHGLESSSRGNKASFFRYLHPEMIIPDFSGSLAARMRSLHAILHGLNNIILVGSSFGGLMATIYAMENPGAVTRLVLLAPALNFAEFAHQAVQRTENPAWLFIGRHDTVTPPADVIPLARRIFTNLHYEEVDDDHMLAATFKNFAWKDLLAE